MIGPVFIPFLLLCFGDFVQPVFGGKIKKRKSNKIWSKRDVLKSLPADALYDVARILQRQWSARNVTDDSTAGTVETTNQPSILALLEANPEDPNSFTMKAKAKEKSSEEEEYDDEDTDDLFPITKKDQTAVKFFEAAAHQGHAYAVRK